MSIKRNEPVEKALRDYYKDSSLAAKVFDYFASRTLPAPRSDVYSIKTYSKDRYKIDLTPAVIREVFANLEELGIGRMVSNRQFEWLDCDLRDIGKIACGEMKSLIKKKNRFSTENAKKIAMDFDLLTEQKVNTLEQATTDDIIAELFARGYKVTLSKK